MPSKPPKIVVFSVSFWRDTPPHLYGEWKARVEKFIAFDRLFIVPGSYSDPKILPDKPEVVQIGIKNTKDYSRDWNYFRVGFQTALYHLLLNVKEFDVAIHVQNSILLNMDLTSIAKEFMKREETIAAPKMCSEMGCFIETALMMLKRPAIEKYITSPMRASLSKAPSINVEEEALYMFNDSWWNFAPEVLTARKKDNAVLDADGGLFEVSDEDFLNLPFIMASNHVNETELQKWLEKNKI